MPIVKADRTAPLLKDAIVLDLSDLRQQADRILSDARQEADRLIAEAQRGVDELQNQAHDEAYRKGYEEGLGAGREEGREQGAAEAREAVQPQFEQLQRSWLDALQRFESHLSDTVESSRETVLAFALKLAERVVHRVVEVDRSVIVDQVAAGIDFVLQPTTIQVRLHPEDAPLVRDVAPDLIHAIRTLEHIDLVEDESVTRGGCFITAGDGEVDARLETQLQRLTDLVLPPANETTEGERAAPRAAPGSSPSASSIGSGSGRAHESNAASETGVDVPPPAPEGDAPESDVPEGDTQDGDTPESELGGDEIGRDAEPTDPSGGSAAKDESIAGDAHHPVGGAGSLDHADTTQRPSDGPASDAEGTDPS